MSTSRSGAHTFAGSPSGNLLDLPLAVPGEVHRHPARRRTGRHGPCRRLDRPLPPTAAQDPPGAAVPPSGGGGPERYYADRGEEPGRWLGRAAAHAGPGRRGASATTSPPCWRAGTRTPASGSSPPKAPPAVARRWASGTHTRVGTGRRAALRRGRRRGGARGVPRERLSGCSTSAPPWRSAARPPPGSRAAAGARPARPPAWSPVTPPGEAPVAPGPPVGPPVRPPADLPVDLPRAP